MQATVPLAAALTNPRKCRHIRSIRSSKVGSGPGLPVRPQQSSWRKIKGFASAPRPIEIAAQPVSSNVAAASAIVRMSPLATTGMRSTASTTARMPARFTEPLNPCCLVRPCMITAATPACSKARASAGAVSDSSSQPSLILTVTGMLHAHHDPRDQIDRLVHLAHERRATPVLTTFRTGQPMLMSTAAAPFSSTQRAACCISAVRCP